MTIHDYIAEINTLYATGLAREHSYRPALQRLLAARLPDMTVINEPSRSACGAPDYIITRPDGLPAAFVEAKDIGDADLHGRSKHREQFERYRTSLDHIAFTDYLEFHLYENGQWAETLRLGHITPTGIKPLKETTDQALDHFVRRLSGSGVQPVTTAEALARHMAGKARLLSDVINRTLHHTPDDDDAHARQLREQYEAFRLILMHDLTPTAFADVYAQTITYGMFTARLHDPTPHDFSRQEAATLIPHTNPFLRKIFQIIAGYDLDERIAWVVDDLAATFQATDVAALMSRYTTRTRHTDPVIHFYEDFLAAYDPRLRKSRGVWYTPSPVVSFIVRAADELLRTRFHLPQGLADASTITHSIPTPQYNPKDKGTTPYTTKTIHRVQILDPATGTGTFLAEALRLIRSRFDGLAGLWQSYVESHLLPRLHGFELLMASYAIAHLKLDLLLHESGYTPTKDRRLRIYLTNALEEHYPEADTLFAGWLSSEANEASRVKRDTPVMVMMGNPPYSVSSSNSGRWITTLLADYKKDLGERNIQPLSDDYIKFLRLAHHYISRTGEGIAAFITNNSFLDGIIHRRMRHELLREFDTIYIIDLHGNSKKKETTPTGEKDENVFDIMQGVSINIFVKTGKKHNNEEAEVLHYDLYGRRKDKYTYLSENTLATVPFTKLNPTPPYYFFVPKDFAAQEEYEKGFKMDEVFLNNACGIVTSKDDIDVCSTKKQAHELVDDALNLDTEAFRNKYNVKDSRDWSVERAIADVKEFYKPNIILVREYSYRPFDTKFIVYTGKTNGIVARPRYRSSRCMLHPLNFSMIVCKQQSTFDFQHVFVVEHISDKCSISSQTKEASYYFPLYQDSDTGEAGSIFSENQQEGEARLIPNLNAEIVAKIEKAIGMEVKPEELFDYIYATLHSPSYRERYKEFLKIDFPRIPYPASAARYTRLAAIGTRLRHLHLMTKESEVHAPPPTSPTP